MQVFVELEDYKLHEWLSGVGRDSDENSRLLEAAVCLYLSRYPSFALEGRALMRVDLMNAELGHRLKSWWDHNTQELPYRAICESSVGFTSVTDVQHVGGKTFSFSLG